MFNLLKDKIKSSNIYEDITKIYNIVDITDNYILTKNSGILKQVHIFKINPVTIINITESVGNNVINIYTEFLRSMNLDFQIYIENTEININNYFNNIVLDGENINKNKLARIYRDEMEKTLKKNNIYISNYYIIVTIDDNNKMLEISNNIYNLSKIGVYVEKLEGKENLEMFLYLKVNKVDNLC